MTKCPVCGWPESEPYEIMSRHLTSEGIVTYRPCACGEVRVHLQPYDPAKSFRVPDRGGRGGALPGQGPDVALGGERMAR